MPAQHVFVCEISSSAVVAARFDREHGRLSCRTARHRRLGTNAAGGWITGLPQAVADLHDEMRFKGPVRIALAGSLVLTRVIDTPRVRGRAGDRVVRFEVEQLLPYPSTDYAWAAGAVSGAADTALWVAAARRSVVEAVFEAGESAGIEVASIEPAPLVLARLLRDELRPTGPRALVHLARETADIVVLDGARSVVRSVMLESGLTDPGRSGDAASIGYGNTCHARVRQEVMRTLAHHRRGGGAPVVLLHLAAPEAEWGTLAAAFAGLPDVGEVTPLEPQWVSMADDDRPDEKPAPILSALVCEPDRRGGWVNLVPRQLLRRARVRRLRPWLQATAALLMLALALPLLDVRQRLQASRDALARRERDAAAHQMVQQQREREQRELLEAVTRVKQLEHLLKSRGAWVRLLNDLQRITDPREGIWIESLAPLEDAPSSRSRLGSRLFGASPTQPAASVSEVAPFGTTCLLVACLLEPSSPQIGDDRVFRRARAWLDKLGECPQVASVEHERFEPDASGLLRVKIVVRLDLAAGEIGA